MAWYWSVKSIESVVLNALPKEFQKEIRQKAWREAGFFAVMKREYPHLDHSVLPGTPPGFVLPTRCT